MPDTALPWKEMTPAIDTTKLMILRIRPYTFFVCVGLTVAISAYLLLLLKRDGEFKPLLIRLLLSLLAIPVGAKLLGGVGNLIFALSEGRSPDWKTFLSGGIAYYGGLAGLLLAFGLLGRRPRMRSKDAEDALAVVIPVFHTFGRIGCFCSGCCYGAEHAGFLSVHYTNLIEGVAVTADRIPVQLIEAGGNLLIFTALLLRFLHGRRDLVWVYLPLYAVLRILTELLRGDALRGMIGPISMSQLISILVLIATAIHYKKRGRERRNVESV